MSPFPQPRPALRRSEDGTVHAIGLPVSSLAVDPVVVAKKVKKKDKDEDVELVVVLPKRMRKQLRRKAARYGWTPEEAAVHVLRAWADS